MIKQYQTKINKLEDRIKGLELALNQRNAEFYALEKENQDLQNQLRDANNTAEERLKIISTLPAVSNGFTIKTFQSKAKT